MPELKPTIEIYKCMACGYITDKQDPVGICDCQRAFAIRNGIRVRPTMKNFNVLESEWIGRKEAIEKWNTRV